jgi:potassium-dependent mechanosensitive channel
MNAHARPIHALNTSLIDYLSNEKEHLSQDLTHEKQLKLPTNTAEYKTREARVLTLTALNTAKIESLEGFLDNRNKHQNDLRFKLKHLQQLPIASAGQDIQDHVARIEQQIKVNINTIDLINENLSLVTQYQIVLKDEEKQLEQWHKSNTQKQQLKIIKDGMEQLNEALLLLYSKGSPEKKSKNNGASLVSHLNDEIALLINNQNIALIHYQINALSVHNKIIKSEMALLENQDSKTLQAVTDAFKDGINEYSNSENALNKIAVFLKNQRLSIKETVLIQSIESLQRKVTNEINQLEKQKFEFTASLDSYQKQLKRLISSRQSLAEYSIDSWPLIMNKILAIPNLFYKYVKNLLLKVYDSYLWLDLLPSIFLWIILGTILGIFILLNRFFKSLSNSKARSLLSGYLYDGILTVLQRNLPYLCALSMLLVVFYMTNIAYVAYQLLFQLIVVWFAFRVLILIARITLLESISDATGTDVTLYYRLKWLFLFGGWATALMTFSHTLPLPLLLQDLFNRLFMLFILTISLVAWKSKDVFPHLVHPIIKSKKRYFKTIVSLLAILIPVTLFSTALIGLCGFINLSWTMSRYQGYVLIVLVTYILGRGLLFDALELISGWMIVHQNNGWLWIEVFLKPLDKILRIALLLLSITFLFQLFGWYADSMVIISLEKAAEYTIINLPGIHITVRSAIEFLIVLSLLIWASRWSREFCYRWLYKEAKDPGVRNSLSVFTQYSVVLLGGFITLRVLGLDFSGMSMILGGLAVGMGFGLRDFASNIVGGIMLLIERPVREGDLITIGEYEGEVAHIGIRSMRVSSSDNTEVLIPNAETFNKPFTNWTHQDGIVRTIIPIKVNRADDPVMIQQLILDVLAIIPEIVAEPSAQALLKKIDAALIEFEVRYFINVQVHNRQEIRSKVLFAITAQFKAAGVKPPVEPITVELKEGRGSVIPPGLLTKE